MTGPERFEESELDGWRAWLAEHSGCDCPERLPGKTCPEWTRRYRKVINKALDDLRVPPTGRG